MNSHFLLGYISNMFFYIVGGILVIVLGVGYNRISLEQLVPFVFFYIGSVLLFSKGKDRRLLSKGLYIRLQSVAFIILNGYLGLEAKSIQFFIFGMIVTTLFTFMFLNEKASKFNMLLTLSVTTVASVLFQVQVDEQQEMVEFSFGVLVLVISNWIAVGLARQISYQERKDYEQERSLDDLLHLIEVKCDEARAATKIKSQFLSNMSHEIRTPINGVLGMNEMILRESTEPAIKKYAHDIQSAARSLLSIINEILDSSKIESGKMEIVPDNYEISSLLNDLYNMIVLKAKNKGLELFFDVDPSIPVEYYGDDIRIRQVLTNLLTNAVKYTQKGKVTMTVTGKIEGENAILHYSVKDTGIGIKEEDMGKLFSEFQRIEEARNRYVEGTGLGMNITVCLLKLMGSELKVQSVYEKGSEFSFDIVQKIVNPEALGDFKERIHKSAREHNYEMSYIAPDAKVLVVDDNEVNRNVFRNLLKQTQIQIYEAGSGMECLEILKNRKFNIIFLDHMMPEMDGIETLHAMRDKNLCSRTPVIMLTANAIVGAKEQYLSEGFDDFLSKPIMPEKLDKMVLKYLPEEMVSEGDYKKEVSDTQGVERLPQLEEFDFDYAMSLLKSEELLEKTLIDFYRLLEQTPQKLSVMFESITHEDALTAYRIEVHALKSTAATVGAMLLSKIARLLEVAAKNKDIDRIQKVHPILLDEIEKHRERVEVIVPKSDDKMQIQNMQEIISFLGMLKMSLEHGDYSTADLVCEQMQKYQYSEKVQKLMDELFEQVMNLEDDDAIVTLENIKDEIGGN